MTQTTPEKVGDKMPDGTVFAGISPDTGSLMYAMPADEPLNMKWKRAVQFANNLDVFGHKDWRVPTKKELDVLFSNRAAIGGFDDDPSSYWSSSDVLKIGAWTRNFNSGVRDVSFKVINWSLRCVR
jgi:hypothetical protein